MFQDAVLAEVDINASWQKTKNVSTSEVSSQTRKVLANDIEVQTVALATVAVQTDEKERISHHTLIDESLELLQFLRRVEPMISEQLKRNIDSHAFDGYEVQWEEQLTVVSCIHTLTEASIDFQFHCTGLSWNSTGSVLVVIYGRFDHQDWCSHKSYLCTWNLDRRSIDADKADIAIDLPSCGMCVSCHPEHPATIAGGTFNGEVRVWNTSLTGDPLLASSGALDVGHKEPVARLAWVLDQESRQRNYHLLSLGNDGKILLWQLLPDSKELNLVKGFRLLTESVPRSLRISKAKGRDEIGGTCLSFSSEDKDLFLVGSENGGLFKCSLRSSLARSTLDIDLASPIEFAFLPHHGPVYGISASPFHRNLFLSCGTDTTARLYSLLDPNPVISFEPGCGYLFCVCWSVSKPLIFAVGTGDGHVLLYDIKCSHIKPRVTLDANPHRRPIYCLEYNQQRSHLLASGDASGTVKVWQLSTELISQMPNEMEQLNSIALESISNAINL